MDEKKQILKTDMGPDGIRSINVNFPSNSHNKQKEPKEEEREKVRKVTTGKVIIRKRSWCKRFMDYFISEDAGSISSYIIHDVLIPAAKDTIGDLLHGSTDILLNGRTDNVGRPISRSRGQTTRFSYNSISDGGRRPIDRERQNRARHNFDDIILETREEAVDVICMLVELITKYGEATVADLYGLVDRTEAYTDRRYGWTDLSSASTSRARGGGYLLNLPRPILLD